MKFTGIGAPPLTTVHQLGSPALTIAELIENTHARLHDWFHENGLWPSVLGLTNGHPAVPIRSSYEIDRETINGTSLVLAIQHLWRKGSRVVYAMDPDLVTSLAGAGNSDVPGELFRQLPHTNPLVVFPEPLPVTIGSTQQNGLVYGFYVHGVTGGPADRTRRYSATDDPDTTHLGFAFVTAVLDRTGTRVEDYDVTRCSVPLTERFSMFDAVNEVLKVFSMDIHSTQAALDRGVSKEEVANGAVAWLRDLLTIGFNTLLYLCSDDPDIQKTPRPKAERVKPKQGKKNTDRRPKPTRLLKVGWRLGAALRDNRRLVDEEIRVVHATTGRRLQPQQRAGHFRMTRYGKGRALQRLTYIKPYWISLDLLDGAEPEARIVPVTAKG